MELEKFTTKSIEALQQAQNLTIKNKNSSINILHLILALVTQSDGLIENVLLKQKINLTDLISDLKKELNNLPKLGSPINDNNIYFYLNFASDNFNL